MTINGIEMVVDRTLSDVEFAKSLVKKGLQNMTEEERESFVAGLKGAYNYNDVNRVEKAIAYLAQRLVDIPDELKQFAGNSGVYWDDVFYGVDYWGDDYENLQIKTDWGINDSFNKEHRRRYLQNIRLVVGSTNDDLSNIPQTLDGLTYIGANNIEKALFNVHNSLIELKKDKESLIIGTKNAWYYSGDLYGGEV